MASRPAGTKRRLQVAGWICRLDFSGWNFQIAFGRLKFLITKIYIFKRIPIWRVAISSWIFELDFRVGFSSWIFELDFRVGFSSWTFEFEFVYDELDRNNGTRKYSQFGTREYSRVRVLNSIYTRKYCE